MSMAKSKTLMAIFTTTLTFLLLSSLATAEQYPSFYRSISPKSMGLGKEKLTHMHFYFHDIMSGPKPTAVPVAKAGITKTSPSLFGEVVVADDPLTVGPEPGSKVVGKAQGIYGFADQHELGLVMVFNFAFTEGKFNGSTFSLLGRNMILSDVRELTIVGGSGAFRFARGYALAHTHSANAKTGDAIVEYNVYLLHY